VCPTGFQPLDEVLSGGLSDASGLAARRIHTHHLKGGGGLAYEADTIIMLNEKLSVVSKAHIANSPLRVEEFSAQVVFSIEKNGGGQSGVDLEFTKNFAHYRFDPPRILGRRPAVDRTLCRNLTPAPRRRGDPKFSLSPGAD
jgi:hypothetical protein